MAIADLTKNMAVYDILRLCLKQRVDKILTLCPANKYSRRYIYEQGISKKTGYPAWDICRSQLGNGFKELVSVHDRFLLSCFWNKCSALSGGA